MSYVVIGLVAAVGGLWLLLDWYPRTQRRGRFRNRPPFSDDDIVGAIPDAGVARELILELGKRSPNAWMYPSVFCGLTTDSRLS